MANAAVQPVITLLATCGNADAGDDAFGSMVAARLRRLDPPAMRIVDLAMRPAGLIDQLDDVDRLILVDAVIVPDTLPGTLIDLDWRDPNRPALLHDDPLSTHGLSIADQIALAEALGTAPRAIRLIAAVIGDVQPGAAPAPSVLATVDRAVQRIVNVTSPHHGGAR